MMNTIAKLFGFAPSSRIDAISRQVAELSLDSVCDLVCDRVDSMSLSEARGYVRARAARIVRRHAHFAIVRHAGVDVAWTDQVARMAIERMVPHVLRKTGVGVPKAATIRLAA